MTPFQLEESANAPCTRTTVGGPFVWVASDMCAPFVGFEMAAGSSTQGPEGGAYLAREEVRLLPGREVVALVDFVEVDEVGVGLLGPAPRRLIELSRKDADGSRNCDALDVEEAKVVLPVETTRGNPGVRQPGERDVVEDLVSREVADGLTWERPCDVLVAVRIVVEHPGGESDGRIGEAVQGL